MASELKVATVFGSEIQTHSSGQSRHLLEVLKRRVHLQRFADCSCAFGADVVVPKAAEAEIRE